jgi:hypothetical protein
VTGGQRARREPAPSGASSRYCSTATAYSTGAGADADHGASAICVEVPTGDSVLFGTQ